MCSSGFATTLGDVVRAMAERSDDRPAGHDRCRAEGRAFGNCDVVERASGFGLETGARRRDLLNGCPRGSICRRRLNWDEGHDLPAHLGRPSPLARRSPPARVGEPVHRSLVCLRKGDCRRRHDAPRKGFERDGGGRRRRYNVRRATVSADALLYTVTVCGVAGVGFQLSPKRLAGGMNLPCTPPKPRNRS